MSDQKKKELEAVVLKDKMQKTVVVEVKRLELHAVYKKYRFVYKKYKAHDESNACKVGDKVLIRETRPISREKRWTVVKVIEKAATVL